MRHVKWVAVIVVAGLLMMAPPAYADVFRAIQDIVSGVLAVPLSTLAGTFSGPPVIGTAIGAINGTFSGLGYLAQGALEVVQTAVPLAKAAAPYVMPFLF